MDKANIIESLDVLKAQRDLQDITRRDDTYTQLNEIVDKLQDIAVFPSLLWVWVFDVIRNIYENHQWEDMDMGSLDEAVPEGVTLKQIFDKFWETSDENGFTMEYGVDHLDEHIYDWMREHDFLVSLEDEDYDD